MSINRVSLILHQVISINTYGQANINLGYLLKEIATELNYPQIRWVLDSVSRDPGTISVVGIGDYQMVAEVVRAYGEIAAAVSREQLPNAGRKVQFAIDKLLAINDPEVKTILFQTSAGEWSTTPRGRETVSTVSQPERETSGGGATQSPVVDAIRGRIECRVYVRDEISERQVRYFPDLGSTNTLDDWIRQYLGKDVRAIGDVYRSARTGRLQKLMNSFHFTDHPDERR